MNLTTYHMNKSFMQIEMPINPFKILWSLKIVKGSVWLQPVF